MLDLSAVLSRRLLPQLTEDSPKSEGIRSWITEGSFSVEAGPGTDSIKLRNITLTNLVPYIAYDYERLSLSSLESYLCCGTPHGQPRAISWPILKLYYSAFFAANAITRAVGRGQFRIEPQQAKRINELASLYSISLNVTTGNYNFSIVENTDSTKDVLLEKARDSKGAHEQFWHYFYSFLSDLTLEVTTNKEPEASSIISEVSAIQRLLSARGSTYGTWLSSMRNEINYQHKHAVWFPYKDSSANAVKIVKAMKVRESSSIRLDYDPSSENLEAFCACCEVIFALNADISNALGRIKSAHRFSRLWDRLLKDNKSAKSSS